MISRWKRNVGQSEKVDGETKKRSVATFAADASAPPAGVTTERLPI